MIRPILALGHPNLRKKSEKITPDFPELKTLIVDLYETMNNASGVGLAAIQVNVPVSVVVVNADPFKEDHPDLEGFQKTYINLEILEETGEEWTYNEGCLSVPTINEDVSRKPTIKIEYDDENFVRQTETVSGMVARILQHEYDHLQGRVFTDSLSSLRRMLLRKKIDQISKGQISGKYKMIHPRK
ncbi:MAG: peptide deformylase [Bacteroidales bacterium]|nr:peptide deformylase [Bacteroidales bacterium]